MQEYRNQESEIRRLKRMINNYRMQMTQIVYDKNGFNQRKSASSAFHCFGKW